MPTSTRRYDLEIKRWIETLYPSPKTKILDVGCGSGKFRKILEFYKDVDAIEVWGPYIEKYGLDYLYSYVYNIDVRSFKAFSDYDLVIMGDVLEHLTVEDSKFVLGKIKESGCDVVVCVPYLYHQDEVDGNPHEEHKQDDLTHSIFMERYPDFTVFMKDSEYGIYYRKAGAEKTTDPKVTNFNVKKSIFEDKYVAIATPTHGGQVTTEYLGSMFDSVSTFDKIGLRSQLLLSDGAPIERSRNQLAARFVQDEKYTHLLFIDSDMGWRPRDVLRLLAFDKDVIGAACRKKSTEVEWNINMIEGRDYIEDGLLEVAEVGTGFLMIKKDVILKMMEAYTELHAYAKDPRHPDNFYDMYTLFQFSLEDGNYRSEDITFCRRWRAIGGQIFIDPEASITHIGQYNYRGSFSSCLTGVDDVA